MFALWRFLVIGAVATLLWWLVFAWWLFDLVSTRDDDLIAIVLLGPLVGLLAAGLWYAEAVRRSLRDLRLSPEELGPTEGVLLATTHSMVHLPGGWFGSRGGKLFLTNRRLVFLPHGGQFRARRITIPLRAIDLAETFRPLSVLPTCGIRILTKSGEDERFGLGVVNQPLAKDWVAMVLFQRHCLLIDSEDHDEQSSGDRIQEKPTP